MLQEQNDTLDKIVADTKVKINDYTDTIFAIIGFAHLYLFDMATFKSRPEVKAFQGRRLIAYEDQSKKRDNGKDVTPDFGIVIDNKLGILGEVKKNFPKDTDRALKEFKQLKQYDQSLIGWNTPKQIIQNQEIILLVHYTTSTYAVDFYNNEFNKNLSNFSVPFSVVEFSQINMAQEFLSFRTCLGSPTELGSLGLRSGVRIPMIILTTEYSTIKLYDAEPPTPYLAELIWIHVVLPRASNSSSFSVLKKNQRILVPMEINDIEDELCKGFCFSSWHKGKTDRQPKIPKTDWVKEACRFMVASGDAEWDKSGDERSLSFVFRKHENIHDHFISKYASIEELKLKTPMLEGF
jgi:hypothetical protein